MQNEVMPAFGRGQRTTRRPRKQSPVMGSISEAPKEEVAQESMPSSDGLFCAKNTERMRLKSSVIRQATKRKFGTVLDAYTPKLEKIEELPSNPRPSHS
jgi:hypothetical protein